MIVSPQQIQELFDYEPKYGILVRNETGNEITNANVSIFGVKFETSHVIWAHFHGRWPDKLIDHKDRDRSNIRISNLREADHSQNGYNQKRCGIFGIKGVYNCGRKTKPWQAQIRIEGRKVNLGRFETIEKAVEAYRQAAFKYHGEFACYD